MVGNEKIEDVVILYKNWKGRGIYLLFVDYIILFRSLRDFIVILLKLFSR